MKNDIDLIRKKVLEIRGNCLLLKRSLPVDKQLDAQIKVADYILSFIDSLQEEPVSKGLDEAASNYSEEHRIALMDYETGEIEMNKSLDILNAFKAGAQWGKNQAMAEIQAQSMALAHGCPEEKINEDLKNAADNALESISDQYDIISVGSCLEMFRLGAEWQKEQFEKDYTNLCNGIATVKGLAVAMTYNNGVADTKEQMMAKAVETSFNVSLPSGLYDKLWIKGCKENDKLLVIKKDEL